MIDYSLSTLRCGAHQTADVELPHLQHRLRDALRLLPIRVAQELELTTVDLDGKRVDRVVLGR